MCGAEVQWWNVSFRLTAPGVEPGLSRPQHDVLTTRRWGPVLEAKIDADRAICRRVLLSLCFLLMLRCCLARANAKTNSEFAKIGFGSQKGQGVLRSCTKVAAEKEPTRKALEPCHFQALEL